MEEQHREEYIKRLVGLFYANSQLKSKDATLSSIGMLGERDQNFWRDQGVDLLPYFTEFPRKRKGDKERAFMKFMKWAGCGGEVAAMKTQDSKLGRMYCVRVARPEFNEPDQWVEKKTKESLFGPEKITRKKKKNICRHRFIEGHKAQGLAHIKLESTRFPLGKIQKVYHLNEECPVYAVLSWVEGENFEKWCFQNRGDENLKIRAFVFWCILKTIERIHEGELVHRDLTPKNIIITPRRIPFITDWGIGRNPEKERDLTVPGIPLGNACYSAPEQIEREMAHLATYRSDVYALGWIMRYMFKLLHPPSAFTWERNLRLEEQHQVPPPFRDLFWTMTRDKIKARIDISDVIGIYEKVFYNENGFEFDPDIMFQEDIEESEQTIIEPLSQGALTSINETLKLIVAQMRKFNDVLQDHDEKIIDHSEKFQEIHKILRKSPD